MPQTTARLCTVILLLVIGPSACSTSQSEQAVVATAQLTTSATFLPATAPIVPTATTPPTPVPPAIPTNIPTPSAPPTPTTDPWGEYAPYTIEALRNRSYGAEGRIEIVRVLEETAKFTRYLIAYPSDGSRLSGMLHRPKGDGPFPVVILNHGYYPLDVYQTGNGSRVAADYLAARGFLTLAPDFRSHAGSDDAPNLFRAGHVIDTL